SQAARRGLASPGVPPRPGRGLPTGVRDAVICRPPVSARPPRTPAAAGPAGDAEPSLAGPGSRPCAVGLALLLWAGITVTPPSALPRAAARRPVCCRIGCLPDPARAPADDETIAEIESALPGRRNTHPGSARLAGAASS